MAGQFEFKGRNRADVGMTGMTTEDPVEFTETRFNQRWRQLTVTEPGDPDNPIAEIYKHEDTGRRSWWATRQEPDGRTVLAIPADQEPGK